MKLNRSFLTFVSLYIYLISFSAQAILNIEITEGAGGGLPIAVVPFGAAPGGTSIAHHELFDIISADLRRSGRFNLLPRRDMLALPTTTKQVRYKNWRILGTESIVIGKVNVRPDGWLRVEVRLLDVYNQKQLLGEVFRVSVNDVRGVAHHISDLVYEKLTGEPGAFSTKMAYVTSVASNAGIIYELIVADADGFYPRTILESKEPIMSPIWSPNAKELAYVSFEKRKAEVFIQNILTGKRKRISSTKGHNGAPSWSPDGTQLAMTLSKSGNQEIYVINLQTNQLRQLTKNWAIDTEASWAPDGRSLIFTSDRGGKPQLYQVSISGGKPSRITFEGNYNAKGEFSPDGKKIVMVHGVAGAYYIATMEVDTGQVQVLSKGNLDESPSFAPNGSMILYAASEGRRGVLAAVSQDGRVHQRLASTVGNVREPAWSPFIQQ